MNPVIRLLSLTCLITALSFTGHGQTAQQVVAKYIDAMGGKEKLQAINSLYQEGTAQMSTGSDVSIKTWRVFDRLYRQEVNFGMGSVTVIVTPGKGWSSSSRSNGEYKSLPDEQVKALQPLIDPAGPLVDYAQKGCRVELDGADTIDGHPCYRIKLSCPHGQYAVYSIDKTTYYILRETRPGSGLMGGGNNNNNNIPDGAATLSSRGSLSPVTLDYSDYRKGPGGYIFPYTIVASSIGAKATISKILVNSSVDADALSRPKVAR